MSDYNNTLNTANGREFERKDRATPDSDSGNVVDHHAPHGESSSPKERNEECHSTSWTLIHVVA